MHCPLCRHILQEQTVITQDKQPNSYYECLHCGSHFLPNGLANFITSHDAKNIDSILPKENIANPPHLICPLCPNPLIAISDDSVPQDVTIYACPNNHGHFFTKGELLKFKHAQEAKLNYHQTWNVPLKTIFAILLPIIILFVSATIIPLTVQQATTSQEQRVKASGLLSPPLVTPISPTETVISFTTSMPAVTSIKLTSSNSAPQTIPISSKPSTNHIITLSRLLPQTQYTYSIVINTTNSSTTTDDYTFSTP